MLPVCIQEPPDAEMHEFLTSTSKEKHYAKSGMGHSYLLQRKVKSLKKDFLFSQSIQTGFSPFNSKSALLLHFNI